MIAEDEVQDKTQTSTAHFVHSAGTVADSHIKEHSATIFDAPSPQMSSSECDDEIRALLDARGWGGYEESLGAAGVLNLALLEDACNLPDAMDFLTRTVGMKRLQARALKDLITNPEHPSSPRSYDSKSRGRGDLFSDESTPTTGLTTPTKQQSSHKIPELDASARKFLLSNGFKSYVEGMADLGCCTMEDVQGLCDSPDGLKKLQGRELGMSKREAAEFVKVVQKSSSPISPMSPEAMASKLAAQVRGVTRSRSRKKAFDSSLKVSYTPDQHNEVDVEARKFLLSNGFKTYVQGLQKLGCLTMKDLVDYCAAPDAIKKLQGPPLVLTPFDAKHFIKSVQNSKVKVSPVSPEGMTSKLEAQVRDGTRSRSRNKAFESSATTGLAPEKYDEVDAELRKFLSVHRLQHYSDGLADLKCLIIEDLVAFCESPEANEALQSSTLKLSKFEASQFTRLVNKQNPRARAGRWAAIEKMESNIKMGNRSRSRTRKSFDANPTKSLTPSRAIGVSPEVRKFLSTHRLQAYCDGLAELGCISMDDLIALCDSSDAFTTLQGPELGISLYHARSLVKLVTVGVHSPKKLKVALEDRKSEHQENGRVVEESRAKRAALAIAQAELRERSIADRILREKREAEARAKIADVEAKQALMAAERLAAKAEGFPSPEELAEAKLAAEAAEYEAKAKAVAEARIARGLQLQRHHVNLAVKNKSVNATKNAIKPALSIATREPNSELGGELNEGNLPVSPVDTEVKELQTALSGLSRAFSAGRSSPTASVVEALRSEVEAWEAKLTTSQNLTDEKAESVPNVKENIKAQNRPLLEIPEVMSETSPARPSFEVMMPPASPIQTSMSISDHNIRVEPLRCDFSSQQAEATESANEENRDCHEAMTHTSRPGSFPT